MTPSRPSTYFDDRTNDVAPPDRSRTLLRVSFVAAIATGLVATGLLSGQSRSARGDDKDSSKPGPAQSVLAFVREIQQALTRNDNHLIALASPIVEKAEADDQEQDQDQDQLAGAALRVQSAEVRYHAAQLASEVARMALDEYQKVAYPQEKKVVEFEIESARAELDLARKAVPEANERLTRIKTLMKDQSDFNRYMEEEYSARLASVKFLVRKDFQVMEVVESKKKVLEEYTRDKTLKELNATLQQTRSDELAKRAMWDLEKIKLTKLERLTKGSGLTDADRLILSLARQAYPIRAEIEAKRDQLVQGGRPDPALETSLRDLTNQLESLVDRAELEWASARFAQLKRQVHSAVELSSSKAGVPRLIGALFAHRSSRPPEEAPVRKQSEGSEPTPQRRPVSANERALNGAYVRLISLAEQALKAPRSRQPRQQLVSQRIETETARFNYQNAKLTREVAEIAAIEYNEGIFPQDLATVEGEIRLARSDLQRTRDLLESGKDQVARRKGREANSVYELHREYQFVNAMAKAEQDSRDRAHRLEQAEAKKKRLVEQTKPIELKKHQIDVDTARATEMAKQAEWEIMKARELRLEKLIPQEESANDHQPVFALIERAVPIEEQVRQKVVQVTKAEKTDVALSKEIRDLTDQLRAVVDEGEALWSAGELARLKPRIEAAIRRAKPAAAN